MNIPTDKSSQKPIEIPKNAKMLQGTRKPGRNKNKSHVKALGQKRVQGVWNDLRCLHPLTEVITVTSYHRVTNNDNQHCAE